MTAARRNTVRYSSNGQAPTLRPGPVKAPEARRFTRERRDVGSLAYLLGEYAECWAIACDKSTPVDARNAAAGESREALYLADALRGRVLG